MITSKNYDAMNLSESNSKIIELLADGKTYKEIVKITGMKYATIFDRIKELKKLHGCATRDQLLVKMLALQTKSLH